MSLVEKQEEGVGPQISVLWLFSGVLVFCFERVSVDCFGAFVPVLVDCFGVSLGALAESLASWEGRSGEAALDPLLVSFYHFLLPGVVGEVVVHVPCQDRPRCRKAGHASLEPQRIGRVQQG